MGEAKDERGSALPLAMLLMWAVVGVMYALALAGGSVNESARAQTAADASALAAVAGGDGQATAAAAANGARVVSVSVGDGLATVEVRVGNSSARAKARLSGLASQGQ